MAASRKIKIGVDFHGVISDKLPYFKELINKAVERGHEVHIITGGPEHYIKNFLTENGVKFTCLFAIMDYYKEQGKGNYLKGEFHVYNNLWDTAKSKYCEMMEIDFHIDDKVNFKHDNMLMCQYVNSKNKCFVLGSQVTLDFSKEQDIILDEIEELVLNHL